MSLPFCRWLTCVMKFNSSDPATEPALRWAGCLLCNEADAVFKNIDIDGDGQLTRDELIEHVLRKGGTDEDAAKIFSLLDVNSDGNISLGELRAGFYRHTAVRKALKGEQ